MSAFSPKADIFGSCAKGSLMTQSGRSQYYAFWKARQVLSITEVVGLRLSENVHQATENSRYGGESFTTVM